MSMNDPAREYFWGCQLTKENPTITWSFDEEDDDSDFLIHTLFLKHAVLGASAVKNERNLVQIETKDFDNKELKQPLFSLTNGGMDMCNLDVSFGHEVPVIFRLVEGSGPVHISAQQLVEFPDDAINTSQEDSELECTETEEEDEESQEASEEEESPKKGKSKKRKASTQKSTKAKKGKMEEGVDSEEDEDDEEEDDDEEDEDEDMEEDDEEESSPEKGKKKAAKKGKEKEGKAAGKKLKGSPAKGVKKAAKKVGKK